MRREHLLDLYGRPYTILWAENDADRAELMAKKRLQPPTIEERDGTFDEDDAFETADGRWI